MNAARRKEIDAAIAALAKAGEAMAEASQMIREIAEGEEEYLRAMPDNLKDGKLGNRADEVTATLCDVADDLDNFDLDDLTARLQEAQS